MVFFDKAGVQSILNWFCVSVKNEVFISNPTSAVMHKSKVYPSVSPLDACRVGYGLDAEVVMYVGGSVVPQTPALDCTFKVKVRELHEASVLKSKKSEYE